MGYTTWNPSDKGANIALTNGNLTATKDSDSPMYGAVRSVHSYTSGKLYWECTVDLGGASTGIEIGIGLAGQVLTSPVGSDTGFSYMSYQGNKRHGGWAAFGDAYVTGNVVSIAVDIDAHKIWWALNGVWQASGDPANGTNPAYSNLSGTYYAMISLCDTNDAVTTNFGASAFSYTVPSGFVAGLGDGAVSVDGDVTIPMMEASLTLRTTVDGDVTVPMMTASALSGITGDATCPMMTAQGLVEVDAPISSNVDVTIPMMTAEGFTGAKCEVTVPMMTVDMEGTAGRVGDINVTVPMMTVDMTGKAESLVNADVTIPMMRALAYLTTGTVAACNVTIPMMTADGTTYEDVTGDIEVSIPMMTVDMQGLPGRFEGCHVLRYDDNSEF